MDPARFNRVDETTWRVEPEGAMHVPVIIYADENLIRDMDDKVFEQAVNVARLPGIVQASYVMPDAHWGYGFPIGGVAAFDPDRGGVISAGGVGFDISCGVRTMLTGLSVADIVQVQKQLADSLFRQIPAGVGSESAITLDGPEMEAMLSQGAHWAVARGWGEARDLERIEEQGRMACARPDCVSDHAKERQRREMGTLGSGNHYLEVQAIAEILDPTVASAFGLKQDEVVVTIHCGSRGLGHQIGTEFLEEMVLTAKDAGIDLLTGNSPARLSSQRWVNVILVRCAQRSIARSPTARSSATMSVRSSRTSFRKMTCGFCSMSRTILARSNAISWRECSTMCSSIARAPREPLDLIMTVYPEPCAPSASRC